MNEAHHDRGLDAPVSVPSRTDSNQKAGVDPGRETGNVDLKNGRERWRMRRRRDGHWASNDKIAGGHGHAEARRNIAVMVGGCFGDM